MNIDPCNVCCQQKMLTKCFNVAFVFQQKLTTNINKILQLKVREGRRAANFLACFLITQPFLNICRHAIHQMKAEYHSYLLVSIILYNSIEVKLKIVKEI